MVTSPAPATASAVAAQPVAQWRLVLGLAGTLLWLAGFAVAEYAHDLLMAAPEGERASSAAHLAYEISAGYVLGFIAALALALLARTLRAPDGEALWHLPWARTLASTGLAGVVAACFAGLLMHNFGGLTPSYDIAFAAAVAVVWLAVLPLAAHIDRTRVP